MTVADAVVVGGGPAGLSAAIGLRRRGAARVVVVERERAVGGIARHSDHLGYGLRDLHRLLRGPAYAQRYADLAERAGVEVLTESMATGWEGEASAHALWVTSPRGRALLEGRAVVLATGCRERSRAARLIPGDRPAGVLTTGTLQQLVTLHSAPVGRRAVVIGAEHVSYSAVLTLGHAGCDVVAMVTELPRHATHPALPLVTTVPRRVPLRTSMRLAEIRGRRRVSSVVLEDVTSGRREELDCDTVVCTGDWVPDHELARLGGVPVHPGHLGPSIDDEMRTPTPGVFAIGNLVHAAEAADRCALDGRAVTPPIVEWLTTGDWPSTRIPVHVESPLAWVSPDRLSEPGARLTARTHRLVEGGRVQLVQGGHVCWTGWRRDLVPGLPIHLPARATRAVDPRGGPLVARVATPHSAE